MKPLLMQESEWSNLTMNIYEGYMPKVGCLGCNNYTVERVE